ncbi:sensor histidine kinase [Rhodococcus zopfii]|uniref:histidine kinase n=1 Tax=Rhodococcus zopfii TaxID=43772 RepID=A0ABU3WLM7_9NOCA|nr:sensor histidine kinase [Rhodococcus zopfii]
MRRRAIPILIALSLVLAVAVVASVDWSPTARQDPARALLLGPREAFAAAEGPFLPVFGTTELVLFLGAGLAFVVSGAVAWQFRPHDLTGPLILAAGLLWLLGGLRRSSNPVLFTIGVVATNMYLPLLLQAVIGFPTGRLDHRWEKWFIGATWFLATVGVITEWMFVDPRATVTLLPSTSTNLLLIRHDPRLADPIQLVVGAGAVVLVAAVVGVVTVRWRHGTPAYRAGFAPLAVAYAVAGLVTVAILSTAIRVPGSPYIWILNLRYPGAALFPLAVAIGLVRYRLARAAISDAMVEIGDVPLDVGFVDALRRAVRDPSLVLWTYSPEDGCYLDADGIPRELPRHSRSRAATIVEREGRPVGAIVYDATLEAQPELLAAVRSATIVALDHERLRDSLREQLEEVRRSRERIVAAGDMQRRRLERDLHDGAQQRLVAASLLLRRAQRADDEMDLRKLLGDGVAELDNALVELRELARGVYPPVLTERGLVVALKSLAERAPLPVRIEDRIGTRLPAAIELAVYLITAEAVTNAAKHSGASVVDIELERDDEQMTLTVRDDGCGGAKPTAGSGLDGLADRAAALGGYLVLHSPADRGTTITVTLPLGTVPTT